MTSLFVTGTDTEVGKTVISSALIRVIAKSGYRVAGMKPIASGCDSTEQGLRNSDAVRLMESASLELPYEWVNPYAFLPAIAPHIAAEKVGVTMSLQFIVERFHQIQQQVDSVVVEGAGGWFVPINNEQTIADLSVQLQLPVVVVIDIRLGCINHALLTIAAIEQSGLSVYGWVANQITYHPVSEQVIASLKARINAPCLGLIPQLSEDQCASNYLRLAD